MKYKLRYDFGIYNEYFSVWMSKIYRSSLEYCNMMYGCNPVYELQIYELQIKEFMNYVEDYLFYFYKFNREMLVGIFERLVELKCIGILPYEKRGVFGYTESGIVYVNPNMEVSRTRLTICHELGHIVNQEWESWFEKFIDLQYKNPSDGIRRTEDDLVLCILGMRLLDEALTVDCSESIASYYNLRARSRFVSKRGPLFNGRVYETNFSDVYGEMQMPAINFAKLFFELSNENNFEALNKFFIESLNKDFLPTLIEEYGLNTLLELLKPLGIIHQACYETFGQNDSRYRGSIDKSSLALKKFNNLVSQLREDKSKIKRK